MRISHLRIIVRIDVIPLGAAGAGVELDRIAHTRIAEVASGDTLRPLRLAEAA